jgi:hypothetical protein
MANAIRVKAANERENRRRLAGILW